MVLDLSDPKGLNYLKTLFKKINTDWKGDPDTILIVGNKVDKAKIKGCEIRKELMEGIGQKFRFNYVEISALKK